MTAFCPILPIPTLSMLCADLTFSASLSLSKKDESAKREGVSAAAVRFRSILKRAKDGLLPMPEPTGKRGRTKNTDAQNLWIRLREHESAVLRFAWDKDVEFSNNRAERDLRMSKVKQKMSGCFRTLDYAQYYCRISSSLKTMRYKGHSSLEAIMLAMQGHIPE